MNGDSIEETKDWYEWRGKQTQILEGFHQEFVRIADEFEGVHEILQELQEQVNDLPHCTQEKRLSNIEKGINILEGKTKVISAVIAASVGGIFGLIIAVL